MTRLRIAALLALSLLAGAGNQPAGAAQATVSDGTFTYQVSRIDGPGLFCASEFILELKAGDRVILLDPQIDFWRILIDVDGKKIGGFTGGGQSKGRKVFGHADSSIYETHTEGGWTSYSFSHNRSFMTSLESRSFEGWDQDQWLFSRMVWPEKDGPKIECLEAKPVENIKDVLP